VQKKALLRFTRAWFPKRCLLFLAFAGTYYNWLTEKTRNQFENFHVNLWKRKEKKNIKNKKHYNILRGMRLQKWATEVR